MLNIQKKVSEINENNFNNKKEKLIAMWNKCEKIFPDYIKEVEGKANGANVEKLKLWSFICREIMDNMEVHCTDVIIKNGDEIILSHNEDGGYLPNSYCISTIFEKEQWFCGLDYWSLPFGNLYTWNSFGVVKSVNWCNDPFEDVENVPSVFAQRHISMASSVEDMIERCKMVIPAHGYHVNVVDTKNNQGASIEVYTDGTIEVRKLKII